MATERTVIRKAAKTPSDEENWGGSAPPSLFQQPEPIEPQTDVDRVMSLIQSSDGIGRAQVKVYKIVDGVSTYCQSYTPREFEDGDFNMLRESFGAGRFKMMLYGEHPDTGNFGLLTRSEVSIAENKSARAAPVQSQQMDSGLSQVLQSIASGQAQMLDALISIKQAPPIDPMAQMGQMLTLMTAMRGAMGLDSQQRKESPIGEIVAAMKELRTASAELLPEREAPKDELMAMAPQVLELIRAGMESRGTQNLPQITQNPGIMPVVQIPQSLHSAPTQPQQPQQETPPVNIAEIIQLRAHMASLVTLAAEGDASIDRGAQFVYATLPDEYVEVLFDEKWFDMLSVVSPAIKPHQAWFEKVRSAVMPMFESEPETPEHVPTVAPAQQPG
jgi:hypothetical protein